MKALLHLLRTHWRLVVLVLIVLLLLPAVVAALMAAEEPARVPAEAESEAIAEPAVQPAEGAQPFAEYREMIERPLFSNTRRPPQLKDAPQDNLDAQQLREAWRLSGIAMQQGHQLASFSERQGERHLLLEQGMVLADEWRLEQIGSDHVLLSNGASEVRLPLREPVAAAEPTEKKQEKKQKKQGKPEKPAQPAAPTDQTTPPAETPAPAAPAQ